MPDYQIIIPETLYQANLLAITEETKLNTKQQSQTRLHTIQKGNLN